MNELYQIVNRNMTPLPRLVTLTGPPITRILRGAGVRRLALHGLLVLLVAIPTVIVFSDVVMFHVAML